MTQPFTYKFKVDAIEVEAVADYLRGIPKGRWIIDTVEMKDGLEIDEWRTMRYAAAELDAVQSGDDRRIVDERERSALVSTDSKDHVEVMIKGAPATISRRLLNRVAIHGGVNEQGIVRENWSAAFTRGLTGYLVQFRDKNDAIMFKLAMWKRPGDDARP